MANERAPRAVTIFGEAGAGKTHLISQYRNQMTDRADRFLISVQLETAPGRFWRFVRKHFAADLLKKKWNAKQPELTGLFRILANRFPEWVAVKPGPGGLLGGWGRRPDDDLRQHLEEFSEHCPQFHSTLRTVLPKLWNDKAAQAARDWLAGNPQTDEQLKALGVPVMSEGESDAEEEARDVVLSLCRLANEDAPIGQPTALVVCFDQIEGLTDSLSDTQALQTFAKAVNRLLNCPGPRMITVFLRESFFEKHQGHIDPAYRDRLMQNSVAFPMLGYEQAVQVIAQRLKPYPLWQSEKGAAGGGACWPFGEAAVKGLVSAYGPELTPRFVIRQCSVWVQELLRGNAITIPQKLGDGGDTGSVNTKNHDPDGQKPDGHQVIHTPDDISKVWTKQRDKYLKTPAAVRFDNAAGLGLPWLRELLAVPLVKVPDLPRHLAYLDLLFADPNAQRAPLGVSVRNQTGLTLTNRLKKLVKEWDGARKGQSLSGIIVMRPKAEQVKGAALQNLDLLVKQDVRVLLLAPELIAEFAAYQEMFSQAMQGNVTRAGKPIDAAEYNAWAKVHLTPAVRKLAEDVFGPVPQLAK